MPTAVCYVRVSTAERQSISVEAQTRSVLAYAAAKGFEVVEVITDEGVSGGVPLNKREGGKRVLELVKSKKVSALIATKLDRCFRSAADCLAVVAGLEKAGVALHLLDLALDTATPQGKLFLSVLASVGEFEKGLIAERVRCALQHKKSKGERVSRFPPFGFSFVGDQLVEEPQEQEAKQKVLALHKQGFSSNKIASLLNKNEVKGYRGARWYARSVSLIVAAAA